MVALWLTHRKTQLDVLAQACRRRARARVALPGQEADGHWTNTRFLRLENNVLLLEAPISRPPFGVINGATVDVFFAHDDERLAFRTRTAGLTSLAEPGRKPIDAWKLAVPLTIERRQQRAHYRVSLLDIGPVLARFINLTDPEQTFGGRITNISGGGLRTSVPLSDVGDLKLGDLFWTTFELPDDFDPFEFVVRIRHIQEIDSQQAALLGCMFCAGDDPRQYNDQLQRIERFVAQRQRAMLGRATIRPAGGH